MDPLKLVNESIVFTFDGKDYEIKKANLGQVIKFQRKAKEIAAENDAAGDLLMAANAIFLALKPYAPELTEDEVLEKCPGDLNVMDTLEQLGFMSQEKAKLARRVQENLAGQTKETEG